MAEVWVLTGGIGSGKSTIMQTLAELGAVTIEADAIGHAVLEPDGAAFEAVRARWPGVIVDGRVDRPALARIVFTDPAELAELEAITHPAIAATIVTRIAEAGDTVVVVEVSAPKSLLGVPWGRTIVADLPVEERTRRLLARGMDPDDVARRMARQPSDDGWRARGRWIVSTEGTRGVVRERVRTLWDQAISP